MLKWIPAHIVEHDFADEEVKNAINVFDLVKIPPEDVLKNIKNLKKLSLKISIFYRQVINELPPSNYWFYK